MVTLPTPKARVEYKKPSRINIVSITMLLFLGACVYVLHAMWPMIRLRSNAKSELADALPLYWRANLRPPDLRGAEVAAVKKKLVDNLRKAGVKDPKLEVRMDHDAKLVAIEARFKTQVQFAWSKKVMIIPCAPRVETDSARVEW